MKFKVEYSQIVRRKMKALKKYLTEQFDQDTAIKGLKAITKAAKGLADFPQKGETVSEMFDEREDFMYKLFGISSESEGSTEYWGE